VFDRRTLPPRWLSRPGQQGRAREVALPERMRVCHHDGDRSRGGCEAVNSNAQAKALRLRLYVACSERARLIDLAEGQRPARHVEGADLVQHFAEEHKTWLEMLGIITES
jgi:hypothetical protein